MSYILDALRKSDQQRQRGRAPTLLAAHAPAEQAERRLSLSHVLAAAVLIAAGAVLGSLRPWEAEQPVAPLAPAPARPPDANPRSSPAPVAVPMEAAREPERDSPTQKPARVAPSAAAPAGKAGEQQVFSVPKAETETRKRDAPSEVVKARPKETPKAVADNPGDSGDAARTQKAIAMSELPIAVQQELPSISFSVHAYSQSPKDRLIGINDRVLREGEEVAPGLQLEQITPDGVIMSYKGYRFRRGVR